MGAELGFGEDGDGGGDGLGEDTDSDGDTDTYPAPEEADGGLYDPYGELIWQDPPPPELMYQTEAHDYCLDLVHGGHDDWRLPLVNELRTLLRGCDLSDCAVDDESCIDVSCNDHPSCLGCGFLQGPAADGCYWSGWLSGWCEAYWTDTVAPPLGYRAWLVDFRTAGIAAQDQIWGNGVRCVRDPS